ncbi:MAG: hypothetical protein MJZ34_16905, partial [Paludibacteraceae bacterium]|nr:hypothetical protein [Paludibacteraceae bacterium]
MTKHDAVAPTCEKNGNVEYYTCSREPGVYYKDENGTNTFNDITEIVIGALGHKASEDWSYDSKNHWHNCEHESCEEHISEEAHNFKETWSLDETQHWHDCEVCEYKADIANHTFNQKVKNDKTLKSAADCTHDAVYYLSCVCGMISDSETFVDEGSALGHDMTKHDCVPPKYNANGVKEYYTCSREEGVLFKDEKGTETFYDEDDLVILPEDWMFGPGDAFGFKWDFSQNYEEKYENIPYAFYSVGFHNGENCISADVPEDETDMSHYMIFHMRPFYPNATYNEDDQYYEYRDDDLPCMLKASKMVFYMAWQPWEYIGYIRINDQIYFNVDGTYDFNTQSYTVDVSELTKDCDYTDLEVEFNISWHHASAFPDAGKELQTFAIDIIGELVAYDGPMPPDEEEFEPP